MVFVNVSPFRNLLIHDDLGPAENWNIFLEEQIQNENSTVTLTYLIIQPLP